MSKTPEAIRRVLRVAPRRSTTRPSRRYGGAGSQDAAGGVGLRHEGLPRVPAPEVPGAEGGERGTDPEHQRLPEELGGTGDHDRREGHHAIEGETDDAQHAPAKVVRRDLLDPRLDLRVGEREAEPEDRHPGDGEVWVPRGGQPRESDHQTDQRDPETTTGRLLELAAAQQHE